VTVKYTAEAGGEAFTGAVRGLLKPYPAARYIDVARDFPEEWEAFLADGGTELALPLTPDMFPGMSGRRIDAVYPAYERAGAGATRLVLNGAQNLALADGTVLPTPGLTIGADPSAPITFRVEGAKEDLVDVGLVFAYQAAAR
jgi:hypothetical protein